VNDRKITRRMVLPLIGGAGVASVALRPDEAGAPHDSAVFHRGLRFTDVGGVMDGSQQGAKLQQWLDEAAKQGGVALLPPGHVTSDRELVVPDGVRIVGSGVGQSYIQYPDLGVGSFALRPAGSVLYVSHLWLRGPGPDVVRGGETIAAMDGLLLSTRCYVEHVKADRFRSGAVLAGDHHRLFDFDGRGNEYGVIWDNAESAGDEYLQNCELANVSKASIGVTSRGVISHALLVGCHLGGAPFGIHRFAVPGGQREIFIDGMTLLYCGVEGCANAVIFDEPEKAGIERLVLDPGGESGSFEGPYEWSSKPSRAWIDIGSDLSDSEWRTGHGAPTAGRPLVRARHVTNVRIDKAEQALQAMEEDPNLRLIESSGLVYDVRLGTHSVQALSRRAFEDLAKGDLCEATDADGARRWRGGRPVGIAVQPVSNGEVVTLLVAGRSYAQPRNLTGRTIPNRSLLRPDPDNAGGVKRAADWHDGPILGRVFADYPIGGSPEYELWGPC
jgi:hypothetical protein